MTYFTSLLRGAGPSAYNMQHSVPTCCSCDCASFSSSDRSSRSITSLVRSAFVLRRPVTDGVQWVNSDRGSKYLDSAKCRVVCSCGEGGGCTHTIVFLCHFKYRQTEGNATLFPHVHHHRGNVVLQRANGSSLKPSCSAESSKHQRESSNANENQARRHGNAWLWASFHHHRMEWPIKQIRPLLVHDTTHVAAFDLRTA